MKDNWLSAVEGAIFDMDGTLLDSMVMWENVGENYLESKGISPLPGLREVLRTLSLRQAAEYLIAEYDLPWNATEVMNDINSSIEGFYRHEAQPKPGVMEMLETMSNAGVPMCVATATDRYLVEAAFERTGLDRYFNGIFTCSEVGTGKDQPDIFLRALEHLGTSEAETWVFEDALYAAETAKGANFKVAVVEDTSAQGQREALLALADRYIVDWTEAY